MGCVSLFFSLTTVFVVTLACIGRGADGQTTAGVTATPTIAVAVDPAVEILELRRNLSELTIAYKELCQELGHLSRHVAYHEKALKHIAKYGHGSGHGHATGAGHVHPLKEEATASGHEGHADDGGHDHNHNHNHHHHHHHHPSNRTDTKENEIQQAAPKSVQSTSDGPIANSTVTHSLLDHHHHHHHQHEHQVHDSVEAVENIHSTPCQASPGESTGHRCSILHEVACHLGHHANISKSFNEQYEEWFSSLVTPSTVKAVATDEVPTDSINHEEHLTHPHIHGSHNHTGHTHSANESAHEHEVHHHDHDHGQNHSHSHQHKRSNDYTDQLIVPQFISEMETSIASDNKGSDYIYATCNVQANRAIAPILQQNVQGRINLWQRKDGSGPVYSYIKLSGFRVPSNSDDSLVARGRRETVLMPVETSAEDAITPPDAHPPVASLEHGFHVHTFGDLSKSCQSTGPHFNPTSASTHGGPHDSIRHMGDLGNLKCKTDGTIDAEYTYSQVSLVGQYSIIGKSLVIHGNADDYGQNRETSEMSKSNGNSGAKIACCIVEQVNALPSMDDSVSSIGSLFVPSGNGIETIKE